MQTKTTAAPRLDWSRLLGFDQIAETPQSEATDLTRIGPKVGIGPKDGPRAAAPARGARRT